MRILTHIFIMAMAIFAHAHSAVAAAPETAPAAEVATDAPAAPAADDHAAPAADDHAAPATDGHAAPATDGHNTHRDDHAASGDGHDTHGDDHAASGDGHDTHGDDHGIPWASIIQHVFNLTVLLGIIFFFGRKAIGDALRQRGLGIRNDLAEAARERDEALQRQADVEARLSRFEGELSAMRTDAEKSAQLEADKLIERAEEAAKRISETAERNIRDEVVRAQVALRKEAVDLAVKLAEDTLKGNIKGDDHRRLARQFLESLDE
jgi:F-type H+-transporting ATPase subunit b